MSRQQQNQGTIIRDLLRALRRYEPPTFVGKADPLAAEEWIRGMERIFKHLSCTDAQKVLCAEFMLVDAAGHWWESTSRTRTEAQQRRLTWTQFKEEMMGKYFPQALRDRKETEFLQLRQGKTKLEDYERKFEQLSRYAPHLVDTEAKKARRFELGLRPEIGGIMASHQFTTYRRVLQTVQTISNRLEMDQIPQQGAELSGKWKWNGSNKGKGEGQNKKINFGSSFGQAIPPCPKCNKMHSGECLFGKHVCYRCGKTGYISKNCKEDPLKKNDEQEKKGNARIFALTQEQTTEDPNADKGKITVDYTGLRHFTEKAVME
ncbi:uncharacterized protein LOC111373178 [Olea europaea var. sylvestris]|uniref:uncharacterized protein LOC111373178 n=1 Tax=Olea europaea var. sylvestris TaxID=158386 RepID=UPI000C1D6809|nr:uncharacterized protein LOC111373178 [Olea europaea var. sylvestris]